LGDIDPGRIRMIPEPGKATEADPLRWHKKNDRLYELVDGTLIEKPMGAEESELALDLVILLGSFVKEHQLGRLFGEAAGVRLLPGLIRVPDIGFYRAGRLPSRGKLTRNGILEHAPDLTIEVISPSNTPAEMLRKRKEYFLAGVQLVWEIDPRHWIVTVYTAPDVFTTLTADQTLSAESLIPGWQIAVSTLFEKWAPPELEKPRRTRKKRK